MTIQINYTFFLHQEVGVLTVSDALLTQFGGGDLGGLYLTGTYLNFFVLIY